MKLHKSFKKIFSLILALPLVFGMLFNMSVLAYGEGDTTTHKFSKINLLVDVPSSLVSFTQTTTNNNSYLELIGAKDAAELQTSMIANNCYLEAVDKDMTYEIAITGIKANDSLTNFTELSNEELNSLFNEYVESQKNLDTQYKEEEITASAIEYYNNLPYFVTDIKSTTTEGVVVYAKKYYTVTNSYIYNFAIQTNTDGVTSEMIDNMHIVLNSAQYKKLKTSIFDNGVFAETMSVIITAAIPIAILAILVYCIRIGNKKKQHKLIQEELELKKKRNKEQ